MKMKSNLIFIVVLLLSCPYVKSGNLEEKFSWRRLDFQYDNKEAREKAIEVGDFIPENNIPFGVEVWRDKVFVTVPRRNPGVPSTLNYISLDSNNSSPLLRPYPDWISNNLSSKFLISTYRVNVDSCDRLWTIDTGSVVDFEGKGERIFTPRIRIFDLKNANLLREYILKSQDYVCDSSYTNIVADIGSSCKEAFAYAVDPGSNALLVYSFLENDSWRMKHPYFHPDPMHTDYKIGSLEFQWDDGLFSIALGERKENGFRNAYIHAMSSLNEFVTSTEILQNKTAVSRYRRGVLNILGSRETTFQAAASNYDKRSGVLFYSLVNKNAIGCWNSKKFSNFSQNSTGIVASNDVTMIYFSDIKVDREANLWAMSNRLPIILYDKYEPEEVNFRIFTSSVRKVIRNTICEHSRSFWSKKV